jgi:DNA-binding SARP family transcriptional activator
MYFRILGPFEVESSGRRIHLGGPRAKAVLVSLVLHANQPVTAKLLVDAVWGGDVAPPTSATVHSYVCRLRARLISVGLDGMDRIITEPTGYRLRLEPGESDIEQFRNLVERGREAAMLGLFGDAGKRFSEADALWRGVALSDIPGKSARAESVSLNEARLIAVEERFDVEIAVGQHARVIPDLRSMVFKYPLRERLAGQLMRALYRCGQQGEALQVYRTTRQALVDELAIEPGPELQRMHQMVLSHDTGLAMETAGSVPRTLPADVREVVGRALEVDRLTETGVPKPGNEQATAVAAINGMAGVGKTTLAVHISHRLAEYYPDGQLFVDMHAYTPGREPTRPEDALHNLLHSIGVPAELVPASLEQRAALWRSKVAGGRTMIVLDDVASAAQIKPLLPGGPGCFVVITSRTRLAGLNADQTVSLPPLAPSDAKDLFAVALADSRAEHDRAAAEEVTGRCAGLPLALVLAAERLKHRPNWSVRDLADQLRREQSQSTGHGMADRDLSSKIGESYDALDSRVRRMFRLLSLQNGRAFGVDVAAAVAGVGQTEAMCALEALVDANMLETTAFGEYRMQWLLHAHACERLQEHLVELQSGVRRLLEFFARTLGNVHQVLFPGSDRVGFGDVQACVEPLAFRDAAAAMGWLGKQREALTSKRYSLFLTASWAEAVVGADLCFGAVVRTEVSAPEIDFDLELGPSASAARAEACLLDILSRLSWLLRRLDLVNAL